MARRCARSRSSPRARTSPPAPPRSISMRSSLATSARSCARPPRRRRRFAEVRVKKLLILALVVACDKGEHRDAREKFNTGVEQLTAGKFEDAEKTLLEARSSAGVDPELRFRAAYDLGMAYAAHADQMKTGKDADLDKALELEQQALNWFSDAARQNKDAADTKANLALVRARP